MAGQDRAVDDDRAWRMGTAPDFVIALAAAHEGASVRREDIANLRGVSSDHDALGRDLEIAFVVCDDPDAVRAGEARGIGDIVRVDVEQVG